MAKEKIAVVIIGGGLAGLMAAAAAVRQGARVTVVTSGPGTVAMGGGGVSFRELDAEQADLQAAVELFTDMMAAAGCRYQGEITASRLIPNALGGFRQVSLAPAAVWAAGVEDHQEVCIAGWRGWSGFNAQLTAELLNQTAANSGLRVTYRAAVLEPADWINGEFNALSIALQLNDAEQRKKLAALLRPLLKGSQLLLLPFLLGTTTGDQELEEFAAAVGCPVGEMAHMAPAASGLRIYGRLQKYLQRCGVEFRTAYPARLLHFRRNCCQAVVLDTPGRPCVVKADRFIVATGTINSHRLILESLSGRQEVAETVAVNECQQLLDRESRPVAGNLYAAGSLVAGGQGYNGNAFALLSGYKAGRAAAKGDEL